jgi:hypothetical protein
MTQPTFQEEVTYLERSVSLQDNHNYLFIYAFQPLLRIESLLSFAFQPSTGTQ